MKTKPAYILFLMIITFASWSSAKRTAPRTVASVKYDGVEYVAHHWASENGTGQNGGYIEARDEKTGRKIWSLVVYKTKYKPNLERDLQDVFITKILIDKKKKTLIVTNERGDVYRLPLL